MKWEQIERQWAAMTRRVQCDWSSLSEDKQIRPDEIASARSPSVPTKGKRANDARPSARQTVSGAPSAD